MRAKWVIVIVAMCVVATAAALAYAAGRTSAPLVIQAQRFELVDAEGRMRGALKVAAGSLGLVLFDEKGEGRAVLAVGPDGTSALMLADEKGTVRAALALHADDSPYLALCNEKGKVMWEAP